jgi:hypothetical protein
MKFCALIVCSRSKLFRLGETHVSKQQFEHGCTTIAATEYTPSLYDCMTFWIKNCNNFADFALWDGLLLKCWYAWLDIRHPSDVFVESFKVNDAPYIIEHVAENPSYQWK